MATQLEVYNSTLMHLGQRRMNALTEQTDVRRTLDDLWATEPVYCLEQGLFRFAKRVVRIDASTDVVPAFGYNNAFPIPNDWIRTVVISTSPDLDPPLLQYNEEQEWWYANATPLYVSYTSSSLQFGMDIGAWPQAFEDYVALRMAIRGCKRIVGGVKEALALLNGPQGLLKQEEQARRRTKANDAMNDPPGLPPVPFWARARRGAFGPGGLWYGSGGSGGTGEN